MFLNINELNIKDKIEFDEIIVKDDNLDKRIHDIIDGRVVGKIYNSQNDEIVLDCEFSGIMMLTDSITLDDVPFEFKINIVENLNDIIENYQECYETRKNRLDLISVLWQNIVLEVPISYTKVVDANLKGNGWELRNEEKSEDIDPRLKKLEDLLKGDD